MHVPWRRRTPPVHRVCITPQNAEQEIATLSGLVRGLNETVQTLWDSVHALRRELGNARPIPFVADHADLRPATWRMPPATADLIEQVDTLERQIDELNGDAERLWFEAQWLRAQLAVTYREASPPNEP